MKTMCLDVHNTTRIHRGEEGVVVVGVHVQQHQGIAVDVTSSPLGHLVHT